MIIDQTDDAPAAEVATYYKDNILSLEEAQHFLESRGHVKEAFQVGSVVDDVLHLKLAATRQTTLEDFSLTVTEH